MKLIEIFDTNLSQTNHPKNTLRASDEWYRKRKPNYDDPDTLSHGSNYVAKKDADPHVIRKDSTGVHSPIDRFKDGLQIYAEAIIMNEAAQDNPFLPRFYDYHIDQDEQGNKFYSFKMEKLFASDSKEISKIPFKSFAASITKDIFRNRKEKELFLRTFMEEVEDAPEVGYNELFTDDIGWYLGEMIDNGNIDVASNELSQALKLIYKLRKEHNLTNDLHGSNLMYRIGPYGVQLVLNDPLA